MVLSDRFRDYIVQQAFRAVEEAASSFAPGIDEQNLLRDEFRGRRFIDKTAVRLGVQSIDLLLKSLREKGYSGAVLGRLFDAGYPKEHDAFYALLTGSFEEVLAVREWIWRNLNETPDALCEVEREEVRMRERP
jgi:hypothetical protein